MSTFGIVHLKPKTVSIFLDTSGFTYRYVTFSDRPNRLVGQGVLDALQYPKSRRERSLPDLVTLYSY
jgi:hypothetical protein